jgi:nucleoid-associated protein YgaU
MSTRRLALTAAAMTAIAVLLDALTPDLRAMADQLASVQQTADALGPDAVVIAAAGLLAWAVWAWGAVGLGLTAAAALPGMAGTAARVLVRVVLPAGARRGAALALGLGLGVAGPLLATAPLLVINPAAAASGDAVPDWPTSAGTPSAPVPDWPAPLPAAADHVVVRGDCLWDIAAARGRDQTGLAPTNREIADAVAAWWGANRDVIGPDPDLLIPGQVLRPPDPP